MTRLPTESRNVKGVDGDPYELNYVCAAPGCNSQSQDPHHLWRRSETIGPYWYVWLGDENVIVGNVVGLCQKHHNMVTQNAAWITWNGYRFDWEDLFSAGQQLTFQPPVRASELVAERPGVDVLSDLDRQVDQPHGDHETEDSSSVSVLGRHDGTLPAHSLDGTCPTCLRPLPHKKEKPENARPRRTWSVTVPKDEREDGAETLDTLLEEARKEMARAGLPYGDETAVKFFQLSAVLGLFVTHAQTIMSDG